MRTIISLIVLLQFFCSSYGQSAKEQLKIINSAQLETTQFYEEISFKNKFGYFIIPMKIGNAVYQYIFDTGGYSTLTSEILSNNKLPELMEVEVGSSNQLKSQIVLTKVPSVKIGYIEFKDIGALNFDFDESPAITCYTNGGLLGKNIIKNGVWQINAQEEKIILTDDITKLNNLDNATRIKVKLDNVYNPFIKAKINGKTYTFLLDFGFGGFLSLTEKDGKNLTTKDVIEIIGEGSTSANGVVKESTFIQPIDDFKIGNHIVSNEAIYYAKSNNYNLIGTEITKHFIVTLNFKDKELYLNPITANKEKTTETKKTFGFSLNRNENTMYVSQIFKNGPAEKANLKLNDHIVSINEQSFTDNPYCDFYDYFVELLDRDDPIVLKVKREESIITIKVVKNTLFKSYY